MATAIQQSKDNQVTSYLGMFIALGSWSMLFATLLFNYTVLRVQAVDWYYLDVNRASFRFAAMNTFVILGSSIFYYMGSKAIEKGSLKNLKKNIWIALSLGVVFLVMQMQLWAILKQDGLTIQSSIAGSLIYLLTGFHAIHIAGGLIALGWILCGIVKKKISVDQYNRVDLVGYFWHFLTLIWIIMFVVIFVVR